MRSLLFICTVLMTASTFAAPLDMNQKAVLAKVQINGQETPFRGVLQMNLPLNQMELKIYNDPCDSLLPTDVNQFRCQAMAKLVHTMKAPIQTREESCGSMIYEGTGTLNNDSQVSISVVDNSTRRCLDLQPAVVMIQAQVLDQNLMESTTYILE